MPLLTDEIIEKAKRGEEIHGEPLSEGEETIRIENLSESHFTKSRRVENEKRQHLQSKLNKILFVVILLIILLVYLVFRF